MSIIQAGKPLKSHAEVLNSILYAADSGNKKSIWQGRLLPINERVFIWLTARST